MFRDWQVEEKLGGTDRYNTEYRAKHNLLGKSGGNARLVACTRSTLTKTRPPASEEFKKIALRLSRRGAWR